MSMKLNPGRNSSSAGSLNNCCWYHVFSLKVLPLEFLELLREHLLPLLTFHNVVEYEEKQDEITQRNFPFIKEVIKNILLRRSDNHHDHTYKENWYVVSWSNQISNW